MSDAYGGFSHLRWLHKKHKWSTLFTAFLYIRTGYAAEEQIFYAPTSFSYSRHSEPHSEPGADVKAGAETSPTNRFSIREKKRLPVCHELTCRVGCCCRIDSLLSATRSRCTVPLELVLWLLMLLLQNKSTGTPRAHSTFWLPFYRFHIFSACILRKRLFHCVSPGSFSRSAWRLPPHPPVATHSSWSPCWRPQLFRVTGEVLKGDCAAFRVTFKAIGRAAEEWKTASSWPSSISQVKKTMKINICCSSSSITWKSVNCLSQTGSAQFSLSLHRVVNKAKSSSHLQIISVSCCCSQRKAALSCYCAAS